MGAIRASSRMNDEITYCADCDHPQGQSRNYQRYRWICTLFPRLEGQGFVDPGVWDKDEPYMRCIDINGGKCPLFRRRIEGQKDMKI